jgi:hypothetical protein
METNNYRSYQDGLHPRDSVKGYSHDGINQNREYGTHNNTKMEEAHDIANQLATTEPVKSANVILTDHNAYVAIITRNGEDVDGSEEVKKQFMVIKHMVSVR